MKKINYDIEDLTTDILIKNDMYKIPVDLIELANNHNIDIYQSQLESKISGAIKYEKTKDKYTILVNENDTEFRKRFTIAHELGHYFLHSEILKSDEILIDMLYRMEDEKGKEKEREADYFAGALLMNKNLLEKMYIQGYSISKLAQIFEVSESAMTVRMDILGLI